MHVCSVADRVKKHFENIEVVNMHNEKDNNEELYCDVIPNADHTCEAVKNFEVPKTNGHKILIYEDLVYHANEQGIIQINTDEELQSMSIAVRAYQEETLGLTKYDFPLICLSPEVEEWLLNTSLMIEEALFPEFFKSPLGEEALRASFAEHAKTDLCTLDIDKALSDEVWVDFFSNFE